MFQTCKAQNRPIKKEQSSVSHAHLVTRIEKSLKCPDNISQAPNSSFGVFSDVHNERVEFYGIFISYGVSLAVIIYSFRGNTLMG